MALTAAPLEPGFQQFLDSNGAPLASGLVYTSVPGGSTPKTTWQDPLQVNANANPITLDSGGRCIMFGAGQYRLQLFSALGELIEDNLGAAADLNTIAAGLSPFTGDTGTGGVQGVVPAPPAGSAAAGEYLRADGTWGPLDVVIPAAGPGATQAGFLLLPSRLMVATDTVGISDIGGNITWSGVGTNTLTIPPDSALNLPGTGFAQVMINLIAGAGAVTLTQGAGVQLFWPGVSATPANRTLAANSQSVISRIGANAWTVIGAGVS